MTDEIVIEIIGRNSNEIGDNLETLTKQLLAQLGFGSFIRNAYKTGAEIDLKARHRVTDMPLICECKAKSKPLGTRAVKLFHSEWVKERQRDNRAYGIILSSSGFIGTAHQWYEELDSETRDYFTLINPEELLSRLIEVKFTLSPLAISTILNERYSLGEPNHYWLVYSSHGLAWIFVYTIDEESTLHTIVDGQAHSLSTWKCQEIAEQSRGKLDNSQLVGLDLRQKVQNELLNEEEKSASDISVTIQESLADVQLALDRLVRDGILRNIPSSTNSYAFIRDIIPFTQLAKHYLESEDVIIFLSSHYAQEMIRSEELMSYIDSRYKLGMHLEERKTLMQLLSISPRALFTALFDDKERFARTSLDIQEKVKDLKERQRWQENHRMSLIQKLVPLVIGDLTGENRRLTNHLSNLGIQRYRIQARIDATGSNWNKLSVGGELMVGIAKVSGSVLAGSLVSASDPISFLVTDALFSLEIEEYDKALELLYKAQKLCEEQDLNRSECIKVLNNIAVALMRQGEWEEALNYLEKGLRSNKLKFPELFTNKASCLKELGDEESALKTISDAEILFPKKSEEGFFERVKEHIHNKDGI